MLARPSLVPFAGTSRAVPCPDLVDPCRAKYFRAVPSWSRAVPNISVPCPHDPCPEIWVPFLWKKKAPAATYPQVKGFQKFGPLGIQAEKQGFRTAWLITGQKFPWKNLKSGSSLLTFRDLSSHICQIFMRMARWGDLHFRKSLDFS